MRLLAEISLIRPRAFRRAASQHDRALADVLRRDEMCDVDEGDMRSEAQDDAFHDGGEGIAQAEVGKEGDEVGHGGRGAGVGKWPDGHSCLTIGLTNYHTGEKIWPRLIVSPGGVPHPSL